MTEDNFSAFGAETEAGVIGRGNEPGDSLKGNHRGWFIGRQRQGSPFVTLDAGILDLGKLASWGLSREPVSVRVALFG